MLGKLSVLGRPTSLDDSREGPIALAVGAGCLDIFSLIHLFSFLSPSLWKTARYRLKYCLKGPLNTKQPTNLFSYSCSVRSSRRVTYLHCNALCPTLASYKECKIFIFVK